MVVSVFYASEAFGMYRRVKILRNCSEWLHRRTKEENDEGKVVL